jgi:hypothetical protein
MTPSAHAACLRRSHSDETLATARQLDARRSRCAALQALRSAPALTPALISRIEDGVLLPLLSRASQAASAAATLDTLTLAAESALRTARAAAASRPTSAREPALPEILSILSLRCARLQQAGAAQQPELSELAARLADAAGAPSGPGVGGLLARCARTLLPRMRQCDALWARASTAQTEELLRRGQELARQQQTAGGAAGRAAGRAKASATPVSMDALFVGGRSGAQSQGAADAGAASKGPARTTARKGAFADPSQLMQPMTRGAGTPKQAATLAPKPQAGNALLARLLQDPGPSSAAAATPTAQPAQWEQPQEQPIDGRTPGGAATQHADHGQHAESVARPAESGPANEPARRGPGRKDVSQLQALLQPMKPRSGAAPAAAPSIAAAPPAPAPAVAAEPDVASGSQPAAGSSAPMPEGLAALLAPPPVSQPPASEPQSAATFLSGLLGPRSGSLPASAPAPAPQTAAPSQPLPQHSEQPQLQQWQQPAPQQQPQPQPQEQPASQPQQWQQAAYSGIKPPAQAPLEEVPQPRPHRRMHEPYGLLSGLRHAPQQGGQMQAPPQPPPGPPPELNALFASSMPSTSQPLPMSMPFVSHHLASAQQPMQMQFGSQQQYMARPMQPQPANPQQPQHQLAFPNNLPRPMQPQPPRPQQQQQQHPPPQQQPAFTDNLPQQLSQLQELKVPNSAAFSAAGGSAAPAHGSGSGSQMQLPHPLGQQAVAGHAQPAQGPGSIGHRTSGSAGGTGPNGGHEDPALALWEALKR